MKSSLSIVLLTTLALAGAAVCEKRSTGKPPEKNTLATTTTSTRRSDLPTTSPLSDALCLFRAQANPTNEGARDAALTFTDVTFVEDATLGNHWVTTEFPLLPLRSSARF